MDNNNVFTNRLQKLLDYYNLSASGLATKIGVQRSSISHIISGRNKPSLDFVMKLLHTYDEVTIEWLIDGKGTFPKSENTHPTPHNTIKDITSVQTEKIEVEKSNPKFLSELIPKNNNQKEIEKIILLYKDGSFESFNN
ncbi:MAG: helix-turn-helix transcriptional regulator [Flavobacteriaceae bacterium]|nr:helix-turn-helix transcriptional regulator [Flavobacteriaceae bacterium]